MFQSLPEKFKEYGLPADVRTLLLLRKAMEKGLINTLGDVYLVLKNIIVKDPKMYGPYTRAYYEYFLNIMMEPGENLNTAVLRSIGFKKWREKFVDRHPEWDEKPIEELIDRYLDEVHLTSYDIKNIIDGQTIIDKDNLELEDKANQEAQSDELRENLLDKAADYSNIDMDEILKRMEEVAKRQKEKHSGGSHWIGTDGISPYGHNGAANGGVRIGGAGGGKMARKVIGNPQFYPVDVDARIKDDNVDAALSYLKGALEESAESKLDVENTIKKGLKRGGLFLPEMEDVISEKMQIILLIDNGGYSMSPYIGRVMELFKKMKTRFSHDLEVFYFHNSIYDLIYTDARRSRKKAMTMDRFLALDPNYKVFIVGDAAMAPYELTRDSIYQWISIKDKFPKTAWLNPEREANWNYVQTTVYLSKIFDMYPLTPRGIEKAVLAMNKKKN